MDYSLTFLLSFLHCIFSIYKISSDLLLKDLETFRRSLVSFLILSGSKLEEWSAPFQVLSNVKCLSINEAPKVSAAIAAAIPR